MKAFPSATGAVGMELRDYFAAKALPLAMKWVERTYDISLMHREWLWDEEEHEDDAQHIAEVAYQIADAMIKEREKA